MNKLTVIKRQYKMFTKNPKTYLAVLTVEELGYLLSLLEEKDKALAFYANRENHAWEMDEYRNVIPTQIMMDGGKIARNALLTSSNNEGETI
ncbi:hypothetical protein [Paenibacillus sp. FSL R7-0128]|uniref:hypothetical protein n=1 Tax=Paenibacillus sp. FSL R7-0128 TaxID=2954529 RepID=UPI0030FC5A87